MRRGGTCAPCLGEFRLKLHYESNVTDLEYLARQVFRFTYTSWRRAYPSRKPVTILYSDLIADLEIEGALDRAAGGRYVAERVPAIASSMKA